MGEGGSKAVRSFSGNSSYKLYKKTDFLMQKPRLLFLQVPSYYSFVPSLQSVVDPSAAANGVNAASKILNVFFCLQNRLIFRIF